MGSSAKPTRLRPHARSFLDSLREFLTPDTWKQAHRARRAKKPSPRWSTQPLVLTLLVMTWCCGDSQPERFETAKAFVATCLPKRRRPGRTVPGFHKALARLPLAARRAVAAGARRRLAALLDLKTEGFVVLGCDGSRLECPRTEELERRLGRVGQARSAPALWLTALVHRRTGRLWAWRLGKGDAAEREHLRQLVTAFPAGTLLVADAGFNGYGLARAIVAAGASFLIRVSGKDSWYTEGATSAPAWGEGTVWLWPQVAQRQRRPPLPVRLIRLRGPRRRDVWLLTNVLEPGRLAAAAAGRYYRWRWENEGLFRTYKRTLGKVKVLSRTVRLVHREAEGALLATQLLLAQGVRALSPSGPLTEPQRCSPRQVLLAIRREIYGRRDRRPRDGFGQRLAEAKPEVRRRRGPKVRRRWPRRVDHKPTKPPKFLTLTDQQKALRAKLESEAA
jgi:Transposase DDE domain